MYTFSFEKLEAWIESKNLTKDLYRLTAKFPTSEKFGLVSQLRRAAISVCSNLAEGSTRKPYREEAHFTTIAYGSLLEILNQLILSHEFNFILEEELLKLRQVISRLANKINALRNSQILLDKTKRLTD